MMKWTDAPVSGRPDRRARAAGGAVALSMVVAGLVACGDSQEGLSPEGSTTAATGTTSTSTSTAGAGGGTGGASAGGAGGAAGATTGGGGAGGSGAAGGGGVTCLAPAAFADVFTIADASFCAVARYDADLELGMLVPSWGRHHGPLLASPNADLSSVTVTRLAPPGGATGALTATTATIAPSIPDPKGFLGVQAVDAPFFEWTVLSWTGAYPSTQGELLLAKGDAIAARYAVNGAYAVAAIGGAGEGRLVYSGASAIDDAGSTLNGLYAADSCGTAANAPRLEPKGDASCGAPALVESWGDASGPVAADADGDVFAVMTSFSGDQSAHAWAAPAIAHGAKPAKGAELFTLPGFGSALAALAPSSGAGVGLVAFQPSDATSYAPLDAIAQRFEVNGGAIAPKGEPSTLVTLAKAGTALTLTSDDAGRLWVGADVNGKATFVVLARTAP